MRLVHFTDIHLAERNFEEFERNFRPALINDLSINQKENGPIELIVITGDLVDQGGHSLLGMSQFSLFKNPYQIFEKEFIEPIASAIGIRKNQFLFVPGNHDIDENEILWVEEKQMKKDITELNVGTYLEQQKDMFNYRNARIRKFKEFEFSYHNSTPNYKFSNNQSTYLHPVKQGYNVGFILLNDSWRCSTCVLQNPTHNYLYFGVDQLHNGLTTLKSQGANINICLLHHSVEDFHEKVLFKKILSSENIELLLYGHHHSNDSHWHYNGIGGCLGFRGRATLNKPDEQITEYQSGYKILDINFGLNKIERIYYRKYEGDKFVNDDFYAPLNGIDNNIRLGGKGYEFSIPKSSPNLYLKNLEVDKFKNF